MATPRQIVRRHVVATLGLIKVSNGYHTNVVTAKLRRELSADLLDSECPATLLDLRDERRRSETDGANVGNNHFREWDMDIFLLLRCSGSTPIEDLGELFLADVQAALIKNRFANSGKPSNITFDIGSNEFERIENNMAVYKLSIIVSYDFTLGDLQS